MREQVVNFVQHKENRTVQLVQEAYKYNKNLKFKWLQKLCCYILKKIGAFYFEEKIEFEQIIFDNNDIIENIFTQEENIINTFNENPRVILIGSKDFSKLMDIPEIRHCLSIDFKHFNGLYSGLNIKVIPWMKGMLVLP